MRSGLFVVVPVATVRVHARRVERVPPRHRSDPAVFLKVRACILFRFVLFFSVDSGRSYRDRRWMMTHRGQHDKAIRASEETDG